MLEALYAQLEEERKSCVAAVMAGGMTDQPSKLGMMIGRYQGLGLAQEKLKAAAREEQARQDGDDL